jgi:RNA polymerase sigma-70 factor (ECF subfamily)
MDIVAKDVCIRKKVPIRMPVDKSADQSSVSAEADDALLIQVYEHYRRPIHSYIYRLLGSLEDADDVTQEVFVRACTAWTRLHERENLSSWLYRIATNLCVDMLRRRKRISWWALQPHYRNEDGSTEEVDADLVPFLADSGGIPEIAERELIQTTLAQLPTDYSVVLVLNAAQGVPYQEIATIIGVSPNAAATRISRAKRMFAEQYQRLGKDGVDKRRK